VFTGHDETTAETQTVLILGCNDKDGGTHVLAWKMPPFWVLWPHNRDWDKMNEYIATMVV
jgi:hypothetical protein